MKKWWMAGAIVMTLAGRPAAAEPAAPLTIDLGLEDAAGVPEDVLRQSRDQVARIFERAGLTVRWKESAADATVHITPQVLGYARAASPVMGVALRTRTGPVARIFLKQVRDFARMHRAEVTSVLALVIAHEVGHLLLRANAHSASGLMRPHWDAAVVREAARGSLTFTDAQAARIRALQ